MTHLLLSPHNDDETLFAAYTCLRHRPRVLTLIDGGLKKHYPLPSERAAESAAAMEILECEYEHLGFSLESTQWNEIAERLSEEGEPERVWAPLIERHGHRHHNRLGELAVRLWPGRVSFYATYTAPTGNWPVRSVVGHPVEIEEGWPELKRQALDCYVSQIERSGTSMHFERPLDEYVVPGLRLNLGSGPNPIAGMINLDKDDGWTFEEGLPYPDDSVDAITESHALMYVDAEDWPFVIDEFARVLVPGGTLRMTHDSIGGFGSSRPTIRPRAKVATSPAFVLDHLWDAGFAARIVAPDETAFVDSSLIQQNYGEPPDVFHVEATTPVREEAMVH